MNLSEAKTVILDKDDDKLIHMYATFAKEDGHKGEKVYHTAAHAFTTKTGKNVSIMAVKKAVKSQGGLKRHKKRTPGQMYLDKKHNSNWS